MKPSETTPAARWPDVLTTNGPVQPRADRDPETGHVRLQIGPFRCLLSAAMAEELAISLEHHAGLIRKGAPVV